jgi:phosphate transport system substrate-binding protein
LFVSGAREILPSPAEDLPKDLLKAFLFAPALPSPSLPVARLNMTRDALRTRLYSAIGVTPDVPVTRATPPPPDEPPVVAEVIAPSAPLPTAVRDPDPVVSDAPVGPMVPGIIAITVPNRTSGKTNSKVPVPAKTTTYLAAIPQSTVTLTGIGPSAPAPLYEHWFEKFTAARLSYQPLGAGRGMNDFKDGKIDFAASDSPVTDAQFLQFPAAVTGVVPIYNLPGITDRLKLTPEVLAGIFLGEIRYWNDHRIVELNPRAGMPPAPINVVAQWTASPSTYAWTDYLSKTSNVWKARMGDAATTVSWPVTALGAKGDQSVADMVQHTPYSLGYVDYTIAAKNKMAMAAVKNRAGVFVVAQHDTLSEGASMLEPSIADSDGSHAYPIASFTYLLVSKRSFDQTKRTAMAAFLKWMLTDGQKEVADFGFAPLPAKVVEREQQRLSRMRGQ